MGANERLLDRHGESIGNGRELGIMDLLTTAGLEAKLPEEAARRRWLGNFHHRPPGGESGADLALRVRALPIVLAELSD